MSRRNRSGEVFGWEKWDWMTIIPIIVTILCMGTAIATMWQGSIDRDKTSWAVGVLNAFSCNVFPTFTSFVMCMLYQHFTDKRRCSSPLDRKWLPLTIGLTIIYAMADVIYAVRYCAGTSIVMVVLSAVYAAAYFGIMRNRKKHTEGGGDDKQDTKVD